jgi:hypothetical protein
MINYQINIYNKINILINNNIYHNFIEKKIIVNIKFIQNLLISLEGNKNGQTLKIIIIIINCRNRNQEN